MRIVQIVGGLAESFASVTDRWSGWLWDAGWQAGLLGALALLLVTGLRRRHPALAYGLILLALLKFLMPPLVPAPQSLREARPLVAAAEALRSERRDSEELDKPNGSAAGLVDAPWNASYPLDDADASRHGNAISGAQGGVTSEAPAAGAIVAPRWQWQAIGMALYFVGLCAVSSWIGISWLRVRHLVATSSRPDADLKKLWQQTQRQVLPGREVRLLVSDRRVAPLAFGLLWPVVVFPRELLASLDAEQRRMVLAHELLHHRRRDPWAILLELGVITLWWFHPIAWLLVLASRSLRERCCDEATLRVLDQSALGYATVLEAVARWLAGPRAAFPLMSATMHPLGVRIHHLLHPRWETRPMKRRTVLGLLALWSLLCLPTVQMSGGARAVGDEPPEQPGAGAAERTATEAAEPADNVAVDRYGDPLPERVVARLGTGRLRHAAQVTGVAFSPDGQILASAGFDETIRFWNPHTGDPLGQLKGTGFNSLILDLAFSPDGTKLASAEVNGWVRLWDAASGEERWAQQNHEGLGGSVAFFPGGTRLAASSDEGTVGIWDAATGDELRLAPLQTQIPRERRSPPREGSAIAISPDGSRLAYAVKGSLYTYQLGSRQLTVIEAAHDHAIHSLAFTPDGEKILSGGSELVYQPGPFMVASLRLWKVEDGSLIREFEVDEPEPGGTSSVLSSSGRIFVSQHRDKLRVWDLETGEPIRTLRYEYHRSPQPHGLAISPDEKLLAASGPANEVMLWNLETGERTLEFPDAQADAQAREFEPVMETMRGGPHHGILSDDGQLLAVAERRGDFQETSAVIINAAESGETQQVIEVPSEIIAMRFSEEASVLQIVGGPHISRWRVETGEKENEFRVHGRWVQGAVFSPDGRVVATSGAGDDSIVFWDLAEGEELRRIRVRDTRSNTLAISADGTLLASAVPPITNASRRWDIRIHLWDAATGALVGRLDPGSVPCKSLSFTSDDQQLISGMADGTVLVWDLTGIAAVP